MSPRTRHERRADTLHRLENDADVWIATSSASGAPHLVPLSLAWADERILVATPSDTPTARNAVASGMVRAALDSASDVVIVDATAQIVNIDEAEPGRVTSYVERVGWDPRGEAGRWSLLDLTPTRIMAWRGVAEITGRTIMRDGVWLD